ncbi:MAG: T9SS type A sorting domain-containing protein [Flavobacteriales bacterium]|nr:T9SS type A sorting domain-containing protein [Flavobacteriales bacterium]
MRRNLVIILFILFPIGKANAQFLSESFESYAVGDYMGVVSPDWTTWDGVPGSEVDVQVTDANAFSGTKSIYFQTTPAEPFGGPQKVLIPFDDVYTTGDFSFEMKLFVESGEGAYFSFQLGADYYYTFLSCQLFQDETMVIKNGGDDLITTAYPADTWFTLGFEVDLNTNDWELLIDGVSQGIVQTNISEISAIKIQPFNSITDGGNGYASYYIDDISYNHTPYSLPLVNAAVAGIDELKGMASAEIQPGVKVRNLGTTTITSFDIDVSYNGTTISESISGLSINPLAYSYVALSETFILAGGENPIIATVSNVNGTGADNDVTDDSKSILLNPIVPAEGRVVVGEEMTGTWCGWCPRGHVFMEFMDDKYADFWAGIAVHNDDPMTVFDYDTGMGTLVTEGFPNGMIDRVNSADPVYFEDEFLDRISTLPTAILTPGAFYNMGTNELLVSISSEFQMATTGSDFNLALVITEDGVIGNDSGYDQANYYSTGTPMGGYEYLPNPVPADNMVYDHVARTIMPDFDGASGIFPASVSVSDVVTENFVISIPEEWDVDSLHIIGMLINNTTGQIDNACKSTVQEAINNGYVGIEDEAVSAKIDLFPNPARDIITLAIGEATSENVMVKIFDINGKLVSERNYGEQNGKLLLPLDVNYFEAGLYSVQITIGDEVSTEKLVIE